jgi:hypothetical protein
MNVPATYPPNRKVKRSIVEAKAKTIFPPSSFVCIWYVVSFRQDLTARGLSDLPVVTEKFPTLRPNFTTVTTRAGDHNTPD